MIQTGNHPMNPIPWEWGQIPSKHHKCTFNLDWNTAGLTDVRWWPLIFFSGRDKLNISFPSARLIYLSTQYFCALVYFGGWKHQYFLPPLSPSIFSFQSTSLKACIDFTSVTFSAIAINTRHWPSTTVKTKYALQYFLLRCDYIYTCSYKTGLILLSINQTALKNS